MRSTVGDTARELAREGRRHSQEEGDSVRELAREGRRRSQEEGDTTGGDTEFAEMGE